MSLRVFYGYAKLGKVIKKPALKIIFENGDNNPDRNLTRVKSWMHVVYTRVQTKEEATDATDSNRMFTVYEHFIDEKPISGDLDFLLDQNFKADSNYVSIKEREEIRRKLREAYTQVYKKQPTIRNRQLVINFE